MHGHCSAVPAQVKFSQSKLAESFLLHALTLSKPRCPGIGAECQCPVVEGTQEFKKRWFSRDRGAGLVGGGAAGANTGYELQAHSSATVGV